MRKPGKGTLLHLYFCTEYKGRTSESCKSKVQIYRVIRFLMFSITVSEATQMTGKPEEIKSSVSLIINFSIC